MRLILKNQRKMQSLTQQELADRIGVTRSAYSNIEVGIRNPSLKLSLKLKEVLNYREDDIFANTI